MHTANGAPWPYGHGQWQCRDVKGTAKRLRAKKIRMVIARAWNHTPHTVFEHKTDPLLPWSAFLRRLGTSAALGLLLVLASLAIGMTGYHWCESLSWLDAFANAAMILSGMGPLAQLQTSAGKLFAGLYALYSGLAVVMIAGIIFAPVVHRFLHHIHLENNPNDR